MFGVHTLRGMGEAVCGRHCGIGEAGWGSHSVEWVKESKVHTLGNGLRSLGWTLSRKDEKVWGQYSMEWVKKSKVHTLWNG